MAYSGKIIRVNLTTETHLFIIGMFCVDRGRVRTIKPVYNQLFTFSL
jgi:hypothetical protein